jgi:hypothetical protein
VLDSERRFWEDEVTDSACVGGNMSSVQEPHLHLEVWHILFLDIVGYSKLLADEEKELVQELNQIVRETEQFRTAEAEGKADASTDGRRNGARIYEQSRSAGGVRARNQQDAENAPET